MQIIQEGQELDEKGFGCDLSEGGVRFMSVMPLTVGSLASLIIHLSPYYPGSSKIKIPARIAQCRLPKEAFYYHIGCEFMNPSASEAIRNFMDWLLQKK